LRDEQIGDLAKEGKKIAEERHNYMVEFFKRINDEVDGLI